MIYLFRCSHCGSDRHPEPFCPQLPADLADDLKADGTSHRLETEWGDVVCVWTPTNGDDAVVYLGVGDMDSGTNATAALGIEEATKLGAELTLAAHLKREQHA